MPIPADDIEERIAKLEAFQNNLRNWASGRSPESRVQINRTKAWVRRELIELRCFKVYTLQPPPMLGGLIMRNVDLFNHIFDPPYGRSVLPELIDSIDEAIGRLRTGPLEPIKTEAPTMKIDPQVQEGYAFVVMAIDPTDPNLVDVLDAIKEGAGRCGINAERVDEVEANERITDRILESIRKAEYVIVDVTHPRPNVFYEAGYAHGIGKLPIYIARTGTHLQFDLKDYPTIFFPNMKELKDGLEKRLRALAAHKAP